MTGEAFEKHTEKTKSEKEDGEHAAKEKDAELEKASTLPIYEIPKEEEGVEKTSKHTPDNNSKSKLSSNTINPTDMPPKTVVDSEGLPENEAAPSILHHETDKPKQLKPKVQKMPKPQAQGKPTDQNEPDPGHPFFKHPKSVAAVIGLSCGALVIMLGSIIALIMRRNQANQSHVVVVDAEPEDQEHLIKMQKSGYENPTYKFFYY